MAASKDKISQICQTVCEKAKHLPFLPTMAFAIVMSTGTLACVTHIQAEIMPILEYPALFLCVLNFLLFVCITPYAVLDWLARRDDLKCQCRAPTQEAFLSTSGIALLVLAHQCLFFKLGFFWVVLFWIIGSAVSFILNFGVLLDVFMAEHTLENITPVLFIPVVGLMVVPVAGCSLATHSGEIWNPVFLIICLIALGAGIMLYWGIFAAMLQRHLLLKPLPDYLMPTMWIHLAPIGWGAVSIIFLGRLLCGASALETLEFFALLAWGASAWWVIMAGIMTLGALFHKRLKFTLAWWSFIFPLGSFATLTKLINLPCSAAVSFAIWLLMAMIWVFAAVKTAVIALNALFPHSLKKNLSQ